MFRPEPIAGAQAVARAMYVLRAVARHQTEGIGLGALTRQTGMNKPTIHRLLVALSAEGMIEQDDQTKKYFLGAECFVLGNIAGERFGASRAAVPIVARIAQECGDTAFFSIRHGHFSECVLREDGDYPLKTHVLLPGDRHPLGIGAGSLAMLAAMPEDEIDNCLDENTAYITAHYPRYSIPVIRNEIVQVRRRGFSVNQGLVVPGSWGIGVAVCDAGGKPIGALSIAAIEARLGLPRQAELAALLRREAGKFNAHAAVTGPPAHRRSSGIERAGRHAMSFSNL